MPPNLLVLYIDNWPEISQISYYNITVEANAHIVVLTFTVQKHQRYHRKLECFRWAGSVLETHPDLRNHL